MRKALVIGYGNPLRGDDGIGQAAARMLAQAAIDGAEVVGCHQLTPEMAEQLATVDLAVFIDAAAGIPPGRVVATQLAGNPAQLSGLVHHVDPRTLLFMSATLYGRSPDAFLVTVGAGAFTLGDGLSDTATAALPEVVATVRHLVLTHAQPRSESTTDPSVSTS